MFVAATSKLKLKLKFAQYYQTAIYFAFVGLWFWSAGTLVNEAGFYKPIILKVQPPIRGIIAHATMPRWLELFILFFLAMIPMNGTTTLVSSVGLEPTTSQSESSTLTIGTLVGQPGFARDFYCQFSLSLSLIISFSTLYFSTSPKPNLKSVRLTRPTTPLPPPPSTLVGFAVAAAQSWLDVHF